MMERNSSRRGSEDIAPQAYLRRHWALSLEAVAGFMIDLLGHELIID